MKWLHQIRSQVATTTTTSTTTTILILLPPLLLTLIQILLTLTLLPLPVGRNMAQSVSRRPITADIKDRAQVNPCGICSGQIGTGTGSEHSTSYLVFPCQYHSTVAL
jgi:hypothetical protein